MMPSLFEKLNHHIEAYHEKTSQEGSMFDVAGFSSWLFPKDTFEEETRSLVEEISEEVRNFEQVDAIHSEMADKVRELFFEVIPKTCSTKTKNEIRYLLSDNKTLQNLLDPDVAKGRVAKAEDESLRLDANAQLARRIAKVKLACKLGYKGELTGKGQGGAQFLTGVSRKPLGVFKTTLEHQSQWKNLHDGPLAYVTHNQAFYVTTEGSAPAQAEEAAYIVSTKMGFGGLVPPTQVIDLGGVLGSFQLVAKKDSEVQLNDFSTISKEFENRDEYSDEEIEMFQIFAVFDYLINNLDRHERNWLIQYTKEGGEAYLHKIHAIDHDRAFIHTAARSYKSLRNHYKWRNLKIAKEPMMPETKNFILEHLTEDTLVETLTFEPERMEGFMTMEKKQRMKEKMHVLRKAAESEGMTFNQIGNIRTAEEIMTFLVGPE